MFFGEHEVGFVFAVCLVGPVVVFGGVFRLVVGGGVVVYRLCGFWLGGGGGFAFLAFLILLVV